MEFLVAFQLQDFCFLSYLLSAMASPLPSPGGNPVGSAGTSSVSPPLAKKITFDLNRDLALLRQLTAQPWNPFFRGSPSYRLVASELADADPGRFSGLTPKAVRDRMILLLELHKTQGRR